MKKKTLLTLSVLMLFTGFVYAQEFKLEASLERARVSPGNPVYLYVTFFGSQDVPKPDVADINGLRIKYVGPATKVSIINGKVSKSISYNYLIIPQENGIYELGPFSVDYMGRTFISSPVSLTVGSVPASGASVPLNNSISSAASGAAPGTGASVYQKPISRTGQPNVGYQSDRVFVSMDIDKTTMYVNEKIDVTIKLFVNDMEIKDIGYPVYSHEGFTAEEFEKPERTIEYIRGVKYESLVFRQTLFGVKEGKFTLGPAKIDCKMVSRTESSRSASFFGLDDFFSNRFRSKTYPVELISDETQVHILPFPKEGRPAGFMGAVGDFSLEVYPQATSVKVGDPVIVKSIVKGYGNLATVTAPLISDLTGFKTYEPQVIIKGVSKIYEQILIPTSEKAKEIPDVSFSFFNPGTRKYVTLEKGPFPLSVEASPGGQNQIKMVSADRGASNVYIPQEKLGEDIVHIKDKMGRLSIPGQYVYGTKYFWAIQILPVILFIFVYNAYRKKERVLSDKGYARLLKAPRRAGKGLNKAKIFMEKEDLNAFYEVLFKTFQEYLGNKFNLSKGNVNFQTIECKLRDHDCDQKVIARLKQVFEKCEMIRYSALSSGDSPAEFLKTVREIIDYLEKKDLK